MIVTAKNQIKVKMLYLFWSFYRRHFLVGFYGHTNTAKVIDLGGDSNPQRRGASDSKSTTLTTLPQMPPTADITADIMADVTADQNGKCK